MTGVCVEVSVFLGRCLYGRLLWGPRGVGCHFEVCEPRVCSGLRSSGRDDPVFPTGPPPLPGPRPSRSDINPVKGPPDPIKIVGEEVLLLKRRTGNSKKEEHRRS